MIPYTSRVSLFPPRPELAVARPLLGMYEKRGWICQLKKNGACTLIYARGSEVRFETRHRTLHKMWTPLPVHKETFAGGDKWSVYVAELIHSKVSGGRKNHLYVFDKIVHDGMQLVGMEMIERHALLSSIKQSEHVSVAEIITSKFDEVFSKLTVEDEGLVLKNPLHRLQPCWREGLNAPGQIKCRVPTKNFAF